MSEQEARRWRLNPDTLQVEPEDGAEVGRFTAQEWGSQIFPPCPVCGWIIHVEPVDVHVSGEVPPVYMPGFWKPWR